MASCKVDERQSGIKPSPSGAGQPPRCGSDDIVEELQAGPSNVVVKSQKAGKFKRTALTFFGVRKGICILPSFFGGRGKNQSKCASKRAIGKSRTHDGLNKVSHDESQESAFASVGDFAYHSQKDIAGALQSSCHDECSHPAVDLKSLSLGRQRKGLRSLFQSFKQHRNQRNVESSKTEMLEVPSPHCKKEVPVVQDDTSLLATECLASEPDVPERVDDTRDISNSPECEDGDPTGSKSCVEDESPKFDLDDQVFDDELEETNAKAIIFCEYEPSSDSSPPPPKLEIMSEPALKSETSTASSDQLNLLFGDVASLKSFDSLTGCGDIIADQEDDSITESSVSGERSRNGGKRVSCYLTYQGGGEEMASSEYVDETFLQDFWRENLSEEMCCSCNPDQTEITADLTSSRSMDAENSSRAQKADGVDSSSIADILSPQSDHQESAPNSDEGYYDSTTPGPEEGLEKTDSLTARLPRDSYSGDALYELFAPDESLISPNYENKSQHHSLKQSNYFTGPVDMRDPNFLPDINRLQLTAELYKDEFLEMKSACAKSSDLTQSTASRLEIRANKIGNLNLKLQTTVNSEPDRFNEKGNRLTEKITAATHADKRNSNVSSGSTSEPDFEAFCDPTEDHPDKNTALPYRNISPLSQDCNNYTDDTVCFSQALVDYTKITQMLGHRDDLEIDSAFTPNMEALPAIVTFDVVDMHNEGEYDEQIHMVLEEDMSSPYQEFEESYLQKEAFADCDYQMVDLYEQNVISGTWAVASLPRHLGLARFSQPMPNPLSLDRRSRSLDTENLELNVPDTYERNRVSDRDPPLYYTKNVLASASEAEDSILTISPQTKPVMALSLPLTDVEMPDKVQSLSQSQVKPVSFPCSSRDDFSSKLARLPSDVSDGKLFSQSAKLYSKQLFLPLLSDSCLPNNTLVYGEISEEELSDNNESFFSKVAGNLHSNNQSGKSRSSADREAHAGSPLNAAVCPVACSKLSEETFK